MGKSDRNSGEELRTLLQHWHQGDVFTLPSAFFPSYTNDPQEGEALPIKCRPIKTKERLVLASQDCDIVAAMGSESTVEALLVRTKDKPSDRNYLRQVARNSAREFVLNSDAGWVADARRRVCIEKQALTHAIREDWSMTTDLHDRFVIWLVRRYDRPAIDDDIVDAVIRPLREQIDLLESNDPSGWAVLNRVAKELRIHIPPPSTPPHSVRLIVVLSKGGLSRTDSDVLQTIIGNVQARAGEAEVPCNVEIDFYPEDELLYTVVQASLPIDLDYVTRGGIEET